MSKGKFSSLFSKGLLRFEDRNKSNPKRIAFKSRNLIEEAQIVTNVNREKIKALTDDRPFTSWSTSGNNGDYIEIYFKRPAIFNTVVIRELTDNVDWFKIYIMTPEGYECIYEQDRIMKYRLCSFDRTAASKIRIEFSQIRNPVRIGGIEIYNEVRDGKNLRVSDYISIGEGSAEFTASQDFRDYFNVITDPIVFGAVNLDKDGNIALNISREEFDEVMENIHKAIDGRKVTLWCSVLFQLKSDNPKIDDEDYRKNFINGKFDKIMKSIRDFADKYGFDGIDYDWEHPKTKSQFAAYERLIEGTSQFAKVSIASVAWKFRFSKKAISLVDHFNVMTYDCFDSRGDHSNIYLCGRRAIEQNIEFGVPREKIFLGIPTYGRDVEKGWYWPLYKDYPELGRNGNIVKNVYFNNFGENRYADVYFNSYTEAADKTVLSVQAGTGGVMIFSINCDSPFSDENSIHRAIYNAKNNL